MNKIRKTSKSHDTFPRFSQPLNIRVSPDILDTVREAARLAQIPLSSWMRDRLLRVARRELRAAGNFPVVLEQIRIRRISPPRKERAMPSVFEAPTRQADKWITRLRKEFSVAVAGAEVVSVRMLRDAGGAKYEKFSFSKGGSLAHRVREEIEEYIQGERKSFDVPIDLSSLTPFSRDVLRSTAKIPYGETRSYKWVAEEAGRPKAVRAVGQALHRNPIPLLIP